MNYFILINMDTICIYLISFKTTDDVCNYHILLDNLFKNVLL